MGYDASSDTWFGSFTFPSNPAGRFLIDLDWQTRKQGGTGSCAGTRTTVNDGTLQGVAGPYVSDDKSDVVEYLDLENAGAAPPIDANYVAEDSLSGCSCDSGLHPTTARPSPQLAADSAEV